MMDNVSPDAMSDKTNEIESVASAGDLETQVIDRLKTCFDPEIPVNIYDLGLIYSVDLGDNGHVSIDMTLTSPACPVAGSLPGEVEMLVRGVKGIESALVNLIWDPPWNPDMMTEAAKLELGFD